MRSVLKVYNTINEDRGNRENIKRTLHETCAENPEIICIIIFNITQLEET